MDNNPEISAAETNAAKAEVPVEETGVKRKMLDIFRQWKRVIIGCIVGLALLCAFCGGNIAATLSHENGGWKLVSEKEISIIESSAAKKGATDAMNKFMDKGWLSRVWEAAKGK